MSNINYIVVHCSDSPQGRGDTAATIHKWHVERGWSGIGYHYVVLEDGTVERGRPHYWTGAHVKNHNSDSLGICLIGRDSFTEEQFLALRGLINLLKLSYPRAEVLGHRDLDGNKSCPNFDVKEWWAKE